MSLLSALKGKTPQELPILPLRDIVLFPNTIIPVFITYRLGILGVEEALKREGFIFVCAAREQGEDLYREGTAARIVQQLHLPDGTYRVTLQGEYRAKMLRYIPGEALVRIEALGFSGEKTGDDPELSALHRLVQQAFTQYAELSRKVGPETLLAVDKAESPERLVNIIGHALAVKVEEKIALLAEADPLRRLTLCLETLEKENDILGLQKRISGKVKSKMDKTQREYILNEQLKEINRELGKGQVDDEFAEIEKTIAAKNPPGEVLDKAKKEINRLRKLQPLAPEAGVLRTYIEWIADLPWSEATVDSGDLAAAGKILDEDHFDLKKAKERIIEFIAVRQLFAGARPGGKGPILCFVGPPGTGKTSLGKSVARALGRKFVRISLGGVRDEAEIRGHRKTYVGALPGKILQSMRKAGTVNPVFLLDEIDKLSSDFRGDPASALLEVLDPEQNSTFMDHYLEVPYDLSGVLFIATANSIHTIPYPLLDRMEIIEIPGYGEQEKLAIAKQFLIPKELAENGLSGAKIRIDSDAILEIIRHWTMESGVRSLEREIARCMRRIAKEAVKQQYTLDGGKPISTFIKRITKKNLEKYLGRRRYKNDVVYREARVGVSYGLAWTESGGAMLPVETICFEGTGECLLTGNLGDVMKESARIAISYLRSASAAYNLRVKNIGKTDFHIHVPEGAIPKDGPSAGITVAVSLLSTLCRVAPKPGFAMTGELTLTGRILPIGGLKEKLLAAMRNGMTAVLLPEDNRDDWEELDKEIKTSMTVHFVENAEAAFEVLFDRKIFKQQPPDRQAGKGRRSGR